MCHRICQIHSRRSSPHHAQGHLRHPRRYAPCIRYARLPLSWTGAPEGSRAWSLFFVELKSPGEGHIYHGATPRRDPCLFKLLSPGAKHKPCRTPLALRLWRIFALVVASGTCACMRSTCTEALPGVAIQDSIFKFPRLKRANIT